MAQSDLEAFIQERATAWDDTVDVTSGSPFDVQVTQPILRRLGTDPFTVNFQLFAQERLNQEFPDMATKEGDAITDLVIKTNTVLWAPILREIQRIQNNLSFRDPSILTLDEAEALGANLFSNRDRGLFARGPVRIYFAQPQSISISPANFVTTGDGLHFYPDSVQSIRTDEMLLNLEGTLYYFDINVIAEKPGDEYNIAADSLVSIANVAAAVRITNKRRFRFGTPDEDAVTYIGRTQQELTERSLVTLRGIAAQITNTFPEVSNLAVVGFNDPEMQRDIIEGGSLGPILAFGFASTVIPDGENNTNSRRVDVSGDGVDFTTIIGPAGAVPPKTWYITYTGVYFDIGRRPRDMEIRAIVAPSQVDLVEQLLVIDLNPHEWSLRKSELTLSEIPGGILFPDSPNGTVSVPDGSIHIGGTTDVYVSSTAFDSNSVIINDIVDESPILQGSHLQIVNSSGVVTLNDFILGTDFPATGAVFDIFTDAKNKSYSLQIIDGPAAGSYRVIDVTLTLFSAVLLTLDPAPLPITSTDFRWQLLDVIDIDLVEPKEIRIANNDGISVQGVNYFESGVGLDFQALGVSIGDILRISNGPVAGDYTIQAVLAPFFSRVQVDRNFTNSVSALSYTIFRANTAGGVRRPMVRITSIDLLDTSSQPIGTTIPYANPIDIRSRSFANVAHGVKVDVRDATLGIISKRIPTGSINLSGLTLNFIIDVTGIPSPLTVTFTGSNPISLQVVADQINGAFSQTVAYVVNSSYVGIVSLFGETQMTGGSAALPLFGDSEIHSSRDIRSATVNASPIDGWADVSPAIDGQLDLVQVLDGFQIGVYEDPSIPTFNTALTTPKNFAPEAGRHVQLGSRSIGSARLFFLDPTSIEFDVGSTLSVTLANGTVLYYKPDPTNSIQKIPGLPNGVKPVDGTVASAPSTIFSSASTNFIQKAILPGDQLSIDFIPLRGTIGLSDPVASLALTTIILSIDGGTDKPITFINDSTSIANTDVTRSGVAGQINRTVGKTICSIVTVGSLQYLEFDYDGSIVVRGAGTANSLLGFTGSDQSNDSPNKGIYTIVVVGENQLTLATPLGVNRSDQGFKVFRPGGQRISSTQMAANTTDGSLYFFDLELVSLGTGDTWNIDPDLQMTAQGFTADGYSLSTEDSDTSFSPIEDIHLHLSRSILGVGVADDPENATQLSGQNIQVNYEMSTLTSNVNNFLTADTERVVNESPLGRLLTPFFVRFDLTYIGGSKENIVIPDIQALIQATLPNAPLEVSAIERAVMNRGATSITNPLDLIAVIHKVDRSITVERSSDSLSSSRLASFIPDVLNITRKIS